MSTKLIVGMAAVCVAGAFFVGREFPSEAPVSPETPVQAEAPEDAEGPALDSDTRLVMSRLQETAQKAAQESERLKAENDTLRATVERARAAGFLPKSAAGVPEPQQGAPFLPEKYRQAVEGVTWPEAGEAAAKMVPLLGQLAEAFGAGKPADQKVGLEIFKWNQKLQQVAVAAIAAKVPGGASNGPFTHPVVTINLIHAALKDAGVPLNDKQVERLRDIGTAYMEQDERRRAGYSDETFELRKLMDECALKDKMFADIDAMLRPEQRDVLHPESVRGRMGIDLYSSGTMWYAVTKAVDFKTREELLEGVVGLYRARGNLSEEEVALLTTACRDWVNGFSEEFFQASLEPIGRTSHREAAGGMMAGWQKLDQVREAARHQLALDRALYELVRNDPKTAADIRGDIRVFIPMKRP